MDFNVCGNECGCVVIDLNVCGCVVIDRNACGCVVIDLNACGCDLNVCGHVVSDF